MTVTDLAALPVTQRRIIPETYLDENNHMNVMWYTHLFSEATGELFKLFGMDQAYFEANQAGSFALKEFVCYLAEVRVGEAVTIRSRVLGWSPKRLHMMHFMVKDATEVIAATGEFLGAHVDLKTRRTSPWPAAVAEAIDRLATAHAALAWPAPASGVIAP